MSNLQQLISQLECTPKLSDSSHILQQNQNVALSQMKAAPMQKYQPRPKQFDFPPVFQRPFSSTYRCNWCGDANHYIKDCPTNADPNFNPHNGKGVPKNMQWKRLMKVTAAEFQ